MREEDHDPGPRHIVKTLQGGFAGVAGGGGEDDGLVLHAGFFPCGGHELRQHAERHVLEGGGGAMKELQHIVVAYRYQGRKFLAGKPALIGAVHQRTHIAETGQEPGENLLRLAEGIQ